jgi:two-component system chemotaxis response regulator CheY
MSAAQKQRQGLTKFERLASILTVAHNHLQLCAPEPPLLKLIARHTRSVLAELPASRKADQRTLRALLRAVETAAKGGAKLSLQALATALSEISHLPSLAVDLTTPTIPKAKSAKQGDTPTLKVSNLNIVSQAGSARTAKSRILVVEDDLINRRLLTNLLRRDGTCDVATSGDEGVVSFLLALEEKTPYDLIILDIMMPGLDGHQMLRQVRSLEEENAAVLTRPCKVIMLSSLDDKKNILDAFKEGCDGYLVKPVDPKKLRKLIAKLVIGA